MSEASAGTTRQSSVRPAVVMVALRPETVNADLVAVISPEVASSVPSAATPSPSMVRLERVPEPTNELSSLKVILSLARAWLRVRLSLFALAEVIYSMLPYR